MTRILLAAALGAALLIPAGTALAAPASSSYSGTTAQRGPVSFTGGAGKVRSFRIGVVWSCTDGDRFREMISLPTFNEHRGTASLTFKGRSGATSGALRMSIGARSATGSFSGTSRYNDNDDLDPQGQVICRTGDIRFTARKH